MLKLLAFFRREDSNSSAVIFDSTLFPMILDGRMRPFPAVYDDHVMQRPSLFSFPEELCRFGAPFSFSLLFLNYSRCRQVQQSCFIAVFLNY
jgi:hypothetical protein